MKDPIKVKMGKASRAAGKAFELKVRHDLESKGWITCKFDRNVEFETKKIDAGMCGKSAVINNFGKLIIAKHKFNFFTKAMSAGNGFPDFICFKYEKCQTENLFIGQIQLVESKMNGVLDKQEKDKIQWIINNLHIPVYVASKSAIRGKIDYKLVEVAL